MEANRIKLDLNQGIKMGKPTTKEGVKLAEITYTIAWGGILQANWGKNGL